jgi:hypothetical protein
MHSVLEQEDKGCCPNAAVLTLRGRQRLRSRKQNIPPRLGQISVRQIHVALAGKTAYASQDSPESGPSIPTFHAVRFPRTFHVLM